jgi:epsilon-lactone hydrolase
MGKSDRARQSCTFGITRPRRESHTYLVEDSGHLLPFPQAPDGIELRHLRAFVAVAEELSFARAADRLYVSSPALSRQIRGLEQLIGSELLRRSTHSVELTIAGEALLECAREILRGVDEAVVATLAAGGETLARIAKLWEPMVGLLDSEETLEEVRAAGEELFAQFPPPPGVNVRPTNAGGVSALLVSPGPDAAPTMLYIHGGAFISGSAFGYRTNAGALATAAQTTVLVPDFRLAPEHPFPASLEDCLRAYRWLLKRTDPEQLSLAGDSSGASLVLSILLTLKDENEPLPGAVLLQCPVVDLSLRLTRDPGESSPPVATDDEVRFVAAIYLGGHPPDDPIVDPLSADLSGLPKMLIQAATGDGRLADAKALARRARDHGVDARLQLFPVDAHAFHLFWSFLPEAADAIEAAGVFVRETAKGAPAQATVSTDTAPAHTRLSHTTRRE